MKKKVVIGVDIGGTKIAAHLSDGTRWQDAPRYTICPAQAGADAILQAVINLCRTVYRHADDYGYQVCGVGVGSAGQIDPLHGIVLDANDNLPGWRGTRIADRLQDALGLPVCVDNDVRAMAYGELHLGAGKNYHDSLFITVGTGIGGAIVRNSTVVHGAHFSAGEIGYILAGHDVYSQPISIEQVASGPALEHDYQHAIGAKSVLDLREVARRADNGDNAALSVIQNGARRLAQTLTPVIVLLDPQAIIVGGGVPEIGLAWWQPFYTACRASSLRVMEQVNIERARLGAEAVLFGASCLAWHKYQEESS